MKVTHDIGTDEPQWISNCFVASTDKSGCFYLSLAWVT